MTGIGLHGDGVPCNWDRTQSSEVFSMNLPGISGEWRNLRIPIFAVPHSWIGPHTWDDLMEIVAWSLRHMYHGVNPSARHDGSPWLPSDSTRKNKQGKALGWNACLCEVRGDWKFFAETFHLPKWNQKSGICWSCNCKLEQVAWLDA